MAGARVVVGEAVSENNHSLQAGFKRQTGSLSPLVAVTNYTRVCVLSRVRLFATPWTVARQAPLSMGFPRQEYWSGLVFPTSGHLPDPGIKPTTPAASAALAGEFFTAEPLGNLINYMSYRNSLNISVQIPFLSSRCKMRIEIPDPCILARTKWYSK